MTDKPTILLDAPALGGLKRMLEPSYEVLCLWEQPDLDAFFNGDGKRVRVIIGGGEKTDRRLVERLSNLGLIARIGSGYEGVDVPHARAHGVEVTNTPGVNADDVADLALALLLGSVRGVDAGDRLLRSGEWTRSHRGAARPSMKGLKVGVLGLGDIGRATAERVQAFKSELQWWGPNPKPDAPWKRADSLLALATWCDALVICARADASNTKLVEGAVLDAVGANGVVVNITRGSIIDEEALIERLKDGRLGGAALDVFEEEPTPSTRWEGVPNMLLTPHIGGNTRGAIQAMVAMALDNVRAFLAAEPVPNAVPE